MTAHVVHLLVRAFAGAPSSLGSNWLGLVFPLLVFMFTQVVTGFARGWNRMKSHWKDNLLLGFAVAAVAWAALFTWCIVTTIGDDHNNLNARIRQLRGDVAICTESASKEKHALSKEISSLEDQAIATEKQCAIKDGVNQTLQKQNRDQQSTINGCLSQAMKLLTPEQLKVTAVFFDADNSNAVVRKARWICAGSA
jgi:hypothetical protein